MIYNLVGILGLEPRSLAALDFESSVFTNFTISPICETYYKVIFNCSNYITSCVIKVKDKFSYVYQFVVYSVIVTLKSKRFFGFDVCQLKDLSELIELNYIFFLCCFKINTSFPCLFHLKSPSQCWGWYILLGYIKCQMDYQRKEAVTRNRYHER